MNDNNSYVRFVCVSYKFLKLGAMSLVCFEKQENVGPSSEIAKGRSQ